MSAKMQQKLGKNLPPGLENLGNTCFMNSTLQCLKAVPELRKCLDGLQNTTVNDNGMQMTVALGKLFNTMENMTDSVVPTNFVNLMRTTLPQFAERLPGGMGWAQQDADDFLLALLGQMGRYMSEEVEDVDMGDHQNAISALFGIDTTLEMRNTEADEPPTIRHETLQRLQCNIDQKVSTIEQGLSLALEGELEKHSPVLQRNAVYKTTQRLHRVPLYLVIQFNRFFWKPTPDNPDHNGVNCKIKRRVKFPLELDIHSFCDEDLQSIMKPARDRHTAKLLAKTNGEKFEEDESPDIRDARMLSLNDGKTAGTGISPNFRGIYELYGVVTHKGRSSNSGHYIGWVKQGPDSWICFDDETPEECRDQDILKLCGDTADWHMAYMAYYRVKID